MATEELEIDHHNHSPLIDVSGLAIKSPNHESSNLLDLTEDYVSLFSHFNFALTLFLSLVDVQ